MGVFISKKSYVSYYKLTFLITKQGPIYSKSVNQIEFRKPGNLEENSVNIEAEEKAPLL